MNILGVIIWFLMPAVAGYVAVKILRWKEMSQIETYLTGFFLLFFLQGLILVPLIFLNQSFRMARAAVGTVFGILAVLALIFSLADLKKKGKVQKEKTRSAWLKKEKVYFLLAVLVLILVALRMAGTNTVLRDDIMLETVKVTLDTETMFQYHPLTGTMMEAGMISSKKLISLPVFYSCFLSLTGISPMVFLHDVMGMMVYVVSVCATTLLYKRVGNVSRKKLYLFFVLYGLLVLSGDYHKATLAYRILYQGYLGETICYAVILPYLLYIAVSWHQDAGSEEKMTGRKRIQYILQLLLPLATSFFIAGLGTGFVLLVLCLLIAAVCCLIQSIMEVRACKE